MNQEIKHCDEVVYYTYEKNEDNKIGKIFKKKAYIFYLNPTH